LTAWVVVPISGSVKGEASIYTFAKVDVRRIVTGIVHLRAKSRG